MFAFFPSSQLSLLNSNAFRNSFPRSKLRHRRRIKIIKLINTPLYNAKSGNLPVKFLCAAADYVAIPKKAFITYPLINFRYLKSRASTTMPLKPPRRREGAWRFAPQISLRGTKPSSDTRCIYYLLPIIKPYRGTENVPRTQKPTEVYAVYLEGWVKVFRTTIRIL